MRHHLFKDLAFAGAAYYQISDKECLYIPASLVKVLEFIIKKCKENGIKLFLHNKPDLAKEIGDDSESCAFFQSYPKPEVHVACKNNVYYWMSNLIHEYCHAEQYLNNTRVWQNGFVNGEDVSTIIEDWLAGEIELTEKTKTDLFNRLIKIELDAEKRTVKYLIKFKTGIDSESYTMKANCYIMFYNVLKHTRKWYKMKKPPYNIAALLKYMPEDFSLNYTKISDILLREYLKQLKLKAHK